MCTKTIDTYHIFMQITKKKIAVNIKKLFPSSTTSTETRTGRFETESNPLPFTGRLAKMDSFSKRSLDTHNKYRNQHNIPLLSWSNDLAREAQVWANNIANKNQLMHADRKSGQGENIFMSSSADFDEAGGDATDSWYSEVNNYNFKKGGFQPNTGHFTQVVWKSSRELGMARAKAKNGNVFVVARYKPGGNMMREFNDNVLPKVSSGDAREKKPNDLGSTQAVEKQEVASVHVSINKPCSLDDGLICHIVETHNQYRIMHSAAPIKWSQSLAKAAKAWAERIACEEHLIHASREDRYYKGENICRMSCHFSIEDALRIWYSEKGNYDYDKPGFDLNTGHFTQIVWRGTREVGIGMAESPDGKLTYLVARYDPPGNILGKFEENVMAK